MFAVDSKRRDRFIDRFIDCAVAIAFVAAAGWVLARLWLDPRGREPSLFPSDPAVHKWFLAHGARVLTGAADPFFTVMMNAPDGVNLMANTTVLGLGVPLAPVTWLLGADVTYVLALTLGLSGTGYAWYWLLSRHVVQARTAAVIGGAFCGFGPGIVSHAAWHTNFVAQFLVPLIVWRVLRLAGPGPVWRNGLLLGLLVTAQAFINEEILLFTALACAVFLPLWAWQRRTRPTVAFLNGLGIAGLTAGVLLAYPLWVQFFGPQHYRGLAEVSAFIHADLASYAAFSTASLSGVGEANDAIAPNRAEENTFFGWPLLVLIVLIVLWRRRDPLVRALAATGLLFALLSLGSPIVIDRRRLDLLGPWELLQRLPIFDAVMPARFGLVVAACLGVLLALGVDAFLAACRAGPTPSPVRVFGVGLLAIALLPMVPMPLPMRDHRPLPQFILDGEWRNYVAQGQTLVPIPTPAPEDAAGIHWAAATNLAFAVPRGYYVGPEDGVTGGRGTFGAAKRHAVYLLNRVADRRWGLAEVTPAERRAVMAQLREWNAAILVVDAFRTDQYKHQENLTVLFGPGQRVRDVWLWDVRHLVHAREGGTDEPADR